MLNPNRPLGRKSKIYPTRKCTNRIKKSDNPDFDNGTPKSRIWEKWSD